MNRPISDLRLVRVLLLHDVRRLGPLLIGLWGVAALNTAIGTAPEGQAPFAVELVWVALFVLVGAWWTFDPLHETTSFWRTRPIPPRVLIAAKAVGVALFVGLGTWIVDLIAHVAQMGTLALEENLRRAAGALAVTLLLSSALAAASRSMRGFVTRAVALAVGVLLCVWVMTLTILDGGVQTVLVDDWIVTVSTVVAWALFLGSVVLAMFRRTRSLSTVSIVVLGAMVLSSGFVSGRPAVSTTTAPSSWSIETFRRASDDRPVVQVRIPDSFEEERFLIRGPVEVSADTGGHEIHARWRKNNVDPLGVRFSDVRHDTLVVTMALADADLDELPDVLPPSADFELRMVGSLAVKTEIGPVPLRTGTALGDFGRIAGVFPNDGANGLWVEIDVGRTDWVGEVPSLSVVELVDDEGRRVELDFIENRTVPAGILRERIRQTWGTTAVGSDRPAWLVHGALRATEFVERESVDIVERLTVNDPRTWLAPPRD